ncbi:DUF6234 family protein [Spirillospora sp. NPDC050679]
MSNSAPAPPALRSSRIGLGSDVLLAICLGVLQALVLAWFWFGAGMEGWARGYDDSRDHYGPVWDQAVTATAVCAGLGLLAAVLLAWRRRAWVTAVTQVLAAVLLTGVAVAGHHEAHPPVSVPTPSPSGDGPYTSCRAPAHADDGCGPRL